MRYFIYKIVLGGVSILRHAKRWLLRVRRSLAVFLGKAGEEYRRTIGFRLYKLWFILRRFLTRWKIPLDRRMADVFGRRGILEILMLALLIFFAYPHSSLYTKETENIYGRQTLLYAMLGPGDQEYEIEEISTDVTTPAPQATRSWREGAIISKGVTPNGMVATTGPQEIAGVSAGGLALTKPTIIPGARMGEPQAGVGSRSEAVYYEVQPGDVVGRIAAQYGIGVATILWSNNLTVRSYIRPGDKLLILPVDGVLHKVARGDTVSKIAKLYAADQAGIIRFNKLQDDGRDIVIGETLIIPGGEKPQPVYQPVVARPRSLAAVSAPSPSIEAPAGSGYVWPTAARHITQYFGVRHGGLDIGGPIGTAVYAAKSGHVITSQCGWNYGYGCYIVIDHGGGVQTLYGHNSKLFVSVDDDVTQGQTISAMGSTGHSSGPHVHFEVRVNGSRKNPLRYVR